MTDRFKDLIDSDTPILIDFYADWCQPCQMMKPILEEVKQSIGNSAKIVKIDTEKNSHLASKLGIKSIPTLILFKNGTPLWRHSGVVESKELIEIINQHK